MVLLLRLLVITTLVSSAHFVLLRFVVIEFVTYDSRRVMLWGAYKGLCAPNYILFHVIKIELSKYSGNTKGMVRHFW